MTWALVFLCSREISHDTALVTAPASGFLSVGCCSAEVDTMSKTVSSIKGLSHLEGREQASVLWIISHHHLTLELQGSIEYTEATPAATGQ